MRVINLTGDEAPFLGEVYTPEPAILGEDGEADNAKVIAFLETKELGILAGSCRERTYYVVSQGICNYFVNRADLISAYSLGLGLASMEVCRQSVQQYQNNWALANGFSLQILFNDEIVDVNDLPKGTKIVRLHNDTLCLANEEDELVDGSGECFRENALVELHMGDVWAIDESLLSFSCSTADQVVELGSGYSDYALLGECEVCAGSDEYYLPEDGQRWDGGWYSNEWLEENTFVCSYCDVRHNNGVYVGSLDCCEDCAEGYENDCDDDDCDDDFEFGGIYKIHDYSNKSICKKISEGVGIKFGIELEVELKESAEMEAEVKKAYDHFSADYIILKKDSSIDENGFEMVTRPDSMSIHKKKWAGWIDDAQENLVSWGTGRCGMHIHIEKASLSQLQLGKMLVFLNSDGNNDFVYAIAGRETQAMERWCKPKPKKISDVKKYEPSRFVALNICDRTAEIRIFRGTLKPESFMKNLEFAEALVNFTKPGECSITDVETPDKFIDYVKQNAKAYPNLHDFINKKCV